jgi:radical SAM superfamily enzyme YgiQ (UPF0313 family)
MPVDALLWCPDVVAPPGRIKPSHNLGVRYVGRYAQAHGCSIEYVLSGHNPAAVGEQAALHRPRVFGVSVSGGYRSNLRVAVSACAAAKAACPGAVTVLGGIIPTLYYREILSRYPSVDAVVRHEGEKPFLAILRDGLSSGIPGVACRKGDDIDEPLPSTPVLDLDEIPHAMAIETPETAMTELGGLLGNLSYEKPTRSASVIASRGCGGACTFCLNRGFYMPVRVRSPMNVAEELTALAARGIRFIRMCDANFIQGGPERVGALCEAIAPLGLTWSAWQRADMTDPAAYRAMRRAGCRLTTMGVESLAPEVRNGVYNKGLSDEQLAAAAAAAKAAGIDVTFEIILGWPEETTEMLWEKISQSRHILRHADYLNISFLAITPGTPMWRRMVGALPPQRQHWLWLRSMHEPVGIWRIDPRHSEADLKRAAVQYLARVYHRPGYLARQAWQCLAHRKRLLWRNRRAVANRAVKAMSRKKGT